MRLALVQQPASGDRPANLARGERAVRKAAEQGAQIIAFAELAFDPFYPQDRANRDAARKAAEPVPGPTTERFAGLAAELGVVLILNLLEAEGDARYDTSPVIDRDGRLLGKTRMVHIADFACFHEKDFYTPGNLGAPVFETAFGRIGVAICYDRHYPEYLRALALAGAELVVIPQANGQDEFPPGVFTAEVQTPAFQNGYFVALVNRVGPEPRITFAGESLICAPDGSVLARAGAGTEEILLADLDPGAIPRSPARRFFLPDRRPELYAGWVSPPVRSRS